MKVLLIKPPSQAKEVSRDFLRTEPLELEYLAAAIQDKHTPYILDLRFHKNKLMDTFHRVNPSVVGITGYTLHVNIIKDFCKELKRCEPNVLTVVGGHHATVAPEDFIDPNIDLIVIGDGIVTFPELLEAKEQGKGFEHVKGLAFMKEGYLYKTEPRPISQIEEFPRPERSLTLKHRKDYYLDWLQPIASLQTSRGCPYRCKFCSLWKLMNRAYQQREPEAIVEELKTIKEKYIFFTDDESLVNSKRMMRTADLIEVAGIKKYYFCYVRVDTIVNHPELIKRWWEIGLRRVYIGFEFIKDEDMEFVNKMSKANDNEKAIKICHDLGIDIFASFIVRPEFEEKDFKDLAQYAHRMRITHALFSVLTPIKGSDLYEEIKEQIPVYEFDLVDFFHTLLPTKLPLPVFYKNLRKLYLSAFSIKKRPWHFFRYPIRRLFPVISQYIRFGIRMGRAHLDHSNYQRDRV